MPNGEKRFIIVDGHAMVFRAFFAMGQTRLTDSQGNPTETILGFFRMLGKLLADNRPDYLAVVFDHPDKSFRHKEYPFYKANRPPAPEEFRVQMQKIHEIIEKTGLPVLSVEGYEADDVIYTLVKEYEKENLEIQIVSADKDLFSLVKGKVRMLRPKKGVSEFETMDSDAVVEKIGVTPDQVFQYMALTGDTSDNVPGVKGIGPKGAAKLIHEYGTLDNIYKNIDSVKPDSLKNKLSGEKENAFVSLDLVTLRDFSFEHNLNQFLFNADQKTQNSVGVFREYELPSVYQEWKKIWNESSQAEEKDAFLSEYVVIDDEKKWRDYEKRINKISELSVDTETTSVDAMQAQLVGVSLSWREEKNIISLYIPVLFDTKHEYHLDYQSIPDGKVALEWLRPVLENEKIKKIGQNIKYDFLVLQNHGVNLQGVEYDTMVISFLLDPNSRAHSLDDLSFRYLQHNTIKYSDIAGTGKKALPLVALPLDNLAAYAAEDAEVTLHLKETLYPRLEKEGLLKLYNIIDKPMVSLLGKMQTNGVAVDTAYLKTLEKDYSEKLAKIESKIHELAKEEFNINSTKELQRVLFEKLEIKSNKKTAKGALSTQASVLEGLKDQHPIIDEILHHRTLSKLLSTYIITLPEYVNPVTKRVHTSLSQTIAATGRLASYDPNLQNIPIKGEDGFAIRRAFVASEGNELLSLDYSQIELRILAHYSEDKHLRHAYENDEDIHDQAAYLLFHKYFDEKTGTWLENPGSKSSDVYDSGIMEKMRQTAEYTRKRSQAKVLNFSIAYGVTQYGLSRNLGISQEEAQGLINDYFASFPGIKTFMEKAIAAAREFGYSMNYFGRKRIVENINHKNRFLREGAERLAINNPIQSTAADLIKVAMLRIQDEIEKRKMKTKMILQIHDELLFEVPQEEKEKAREMIQDAMENSVKLDVPLKVTGGFGKNWAEAK